MYKELAAMVDNAPWAFDRPDGIDLKQEQKLWDEGGEVSDEKLALLALIKGFREVLLQAIANAHSNATLYYWQIEKLDQMVERLTDQE